VLWLIEGNLVRRRDFITAIAGSMAAWPAVASAQQLRAPRVGMLLAYSSSDPELRSRTDAFTSELKQLGWVAGRTVQIDFRYAGSDDKLLNTYAVELVTSNPDVIVVQSNPGLAAVLRINRTIPTVFIQVADPLGSGFVRSLAHPEGIATGFTNFEPANAGKWVELLKEISPDVRRVIVLMDTGTKAHVAMYAAAAVAAKTLNVEISSSGVSGADELIAAIDECAREPNSGVLALPHAVTSANRTLIAQRCISQRLPSVGAFSFMARSGLLASYGIDVVDLFRRAPTYVDRILRGAKAADLPVQLPTKFELVVNLKTAKLLGMEVPPTLLGRADEVIE